MRPARKDSLYRSLPAHIRVRDHEHGLALKALMTLFEREIEVVEKDIDVTYDNWFIETCEGWVIPYIGDLVGVRPLRPIGPGKDRLRPYVANILSLRQAKGTLLSVERIAGDVTGWPVHGVEFFRRLIQSQNLDSLRRDHHGTVNIRDAISARRAHGPFEDHAHNIEVRSLASGRGRYNIPNIGLFVWRIQSYFMGTLAGSDGEYTGGVQPETSSLGEGFHLFDPLGRDIPLFNRVVRKESSEVLSSPRNLPLRLSRSMFDARSVLPNALDEKPVLSIRMNHTKIPPEALWACDLSDRDDSEGDTTWPVPSQPGQILFDPALGRFSLHPDDRGKPLETTYAYGFPHDVGGGPYDRKTSVDQWMETFFSEVHIQIGVTQLPEEWVNGPPGEDEDSSVEIHIETSLKAAIETWNEKVVPGLRGMIVLLDSATYDTEGEEVTIPSESHLAIVAGNWSRQGTPRRIDPRGVRPCVTGAVLVGGTADPDETPGALIVDGPWIEGGVEVQAGHLGRLCLHHTSLGLGAKGLAHGITVEGLNSELEILLDHVLCGPSILPSFTGTLTIHGSILGEDRDPDSDPEAMPFVIDGSDANLVITSSTLFGRVQVRTLWASETIFVGSVSTRRKQAGCIRFSYVPFKSSTPRRFACVPDESLEAEKERRRGESSPGLSEAEIEDLVTRLQPRFTSRSSEDPAFAQLAPSCPMEIREGGEGRTEMGVYRELMEPKRRANLKDALAEFLPLGLEAGPIFEN